MRMPVGPGTMRLSPRDHPYGEVALNGQHEKASVTVRAATREISLTRSRRFRLVARSHLGRVSIACRCGISATGVESSHWVQMARRLAWQLGQKLRLLKENTSRFSCVSAGIAADAGKPVLEHAAGEALAGHMRENRTPRAVPAREELVVDRLQAM